MKREEAVLRELNLYPQWKLREGKGEAIAHPAAAPTLPSPASGITSDLAAVLGRPSRMASSFIRGAGGEGEEIPTHHGKINRGQIISELGWPELKTMVRGCTACKLRAGCTQTVFGVGDEKADWLFIGEAPGADEDARGEPFVGEAGKLLDNMLLSIKLKRGKKVYIANIVKCRPPLSDAGKQLAPEPDEIATCLPYLQRQIALIQPKIIVALGKTAATTLLERDELLGNLRGTVHDYQGIPLIVTYHPAYLLRTPSDKAKAWEDLCLAVKTAGS